MKKLLIATATLAALAILYIAAPFVTVWSVREAIRSGDSAYLDAKLEWPTVRTSLRESMTEYAIGPTPAALPGAPAQQPGFWQRVKNGLSRRAVDNLVERCTSRPRDCRSCSACASFTVRTSRPAPLIPHRYLGTSERTGSGRASSAPNSTH